MSSSESMSRVAPIFESLSLTPLSVSGEFIAAVGSCPSTSTVLSPSESESREGSPSFRVAVALTLTLLGEKSIGESDFVISLSSLVRTPVILSNFLPLKYPSVNPPLEKTSFRRSFSEPPAHLLAGVFGREHAHQVDEMFHPRTVPGGGNIAGGMQRFEHAVGVIDQRAKLVHLFLRQSVAQPQRDLFTDNARAVIHDVTEGFVFAVDVAHEMLCAFGQAEDGAQPGDFGAQLFQRGILLRKQTKVFQALRRKGGFHDRLLTVGEVIVGIIA